MPIPEMKPYRYHLSLTDCRYLLRDTYTRNREYMGDLVLNLLVDMNGADASDIAWRDWQGSVLSLEAEGRSLHLDRPAPHWLELCRPPENAGFISIGRERWESYLNQYFGGAYQSTHLTSTFNLYTEVRRHGPNHGSKLEAARYVRDAELFALLVPEVVLSTRFDELILEANRIFQVDEVPDQPTALEPTKEHLND